MSKIILGRIHNKLNLIHGSFTEELIEQTLSCKYLNETDVVLEIGGNMGRNALVVSCILNNNTNLVTMEPNYNFYNKLNENKNINNKIFHIENAALSLTPLLFNDSLTFSDNDCDEKFPISTNHIKNNKNNLNSVKIITYEELEKKYNLVFNVLLVDCEGSFYYILRDMGYILNNINLIIMENDYENKEHYDYVKKILVEKNFLCIESIPLHGYPNSCPWDAPCKENFYEVWNKNI
jgi:FkbM family methyltransferase